MIGSADQMLRLSRDFGKRENSLRCGGKANRGVETISNGTQDFPGVTGLNIGYLV